MGNKHGTGCFAGPGGCCLFPSSDGRKKLNGGHEDVYIRQRPNQQSHDEEPELLVRQTSYANLQHISEREPEDTLGDPSNHPTTGTLFIQRSKSEILKNNHRMHRSGRSNRTSRYMETHHHEHWPLPKKFSSCSTIYLDDSTVSQPNLKNTIKTVALAVYFHIRNRSRELEKTRHLDIFDERKHPITKEALSDDYAMRDPEHKAIYKFIRTLFNAAQLTAECAIVTLVYLERLLTYAEITLSPSTWKRILLGAILLASKVWDDQAVWNVDFCQILKDTHVEDMNELERQILELLQFNINVPSSVYAKYYFDLRSMADAHDLSFPLEQLDKERAIRLEAMSCLYADKIQDNIRIDLRRSTSLDGRTTMSKFNRAILS